MLVSVAAASPFRPLARRALHSRRSCGSKGLAQVSGKLRQPLSKRLRQYKNPHRGRTAAASRLSAVPGNLFCHKKQGYGDPGHGGQAPLPPPAKQPLY